MTWSKEKELYELWPLLIFSLGAWQCSKPLKNIKRHVLRVFYHQTRPLLKFRITYLIACLLSQLGCLIDSSGLTCLKLKPSSTIPNQLFFFFFSKPAFLTPFPLWAYSNAIYAFAQAKNLIVILDCFLCFTLHIQPIGTAFWLDFQNLTRIWRCNHLSYYPSGPNHHHLFLNCSSCFSAFAQLQSI